MSSDDNRPKQNIVENRSVLNDIILYLYVMVFMLIMLL